MKRSSLSLTSAELALILETVENASTKLRTKDAQNLARGIEAKQPGANVKMEKLVHRLGDRFSNLSEGAIRPLVENWFKLEKAGADQRAILNKLDAMNRKSMKVGA